MPNGRSYKSDESFLEKISMGAIGTRFVFNDLIEQGHNPIELERSSMSFKIWKNIKIKRVRVPDILCVDCGTRFESRAKTNLEISMSHSISDPKRAWDYGLKDSDYVALVRCSKIGTKPIDWQAYSPVQYIAVSDLKNAYQSGCITRSKQKGAEEGFEFRIIWPASISNYAGTINTTSNNRLQYIRSQNNRKVTLQLSKKDILLNSFVKQGDHVGEGQILASVVPVRKELSCEKSKDISYYLSQLRSLSLSDRYAAIKAISVLNAEIAKDALKERMVDDEEIHVRLEAASTLMKTGDEEGIEFLQNMVNDDNLAYRLETVIILGEIGSKASLQILRNVLLDNEQNPEIRSAAAWSIGELRQPESIEILMQSFDEVDEIIKVEAARSLAKLADGNTPKLIEQFKTTSIHRRSGIAWALAHRGRFNVTDLMSCFVDDDTRQWISYVIGSKNESDYIVQIEELKEKDSEVYFAVTVLWKIMSSWVHKLEEY